MRKTKYMVKRTLIFKALSLVAVLCPLLAFGVTQKEMEQARTIAAKAYIRYANDGSGYLDDINPTTMEELEAALKTKEKENIKAFKAIPVPTDYKDWNKDKLVEYWAVTAFQNKGLLEKGRGGRIRARSQINKMTIAPPQAEPAPVVSATSQDNGNNPSPVSEAAANENNGLTPELNSEQPSQLVPGEELDEEEINTDKATNYTWVYIMVLAILVAIVVALVVYAANVMKKNNSQPRRESLRSEEESETIEHYESMISDKDVEISMLKKKLENASKQNSDLKAQLEGLTAELAALKAKRTSETVSKPEYNSVHEIPKREVSPEPGSSKPLVRTIFLGRANMRGIFVRADKNLNVGHSVYILETSDGFSGTFRVADSPAAWSLALSNPKEYLETACTGHDLNNTTDATKIITESAGTAVFEGGCWRVIRKARIQYE